MKVAADTQRTITDFEKAITRRQPVTLTYTSDTGAETVRTVEPYELHLCKDGNLVIRTLCRMRGHYRSFRPESIRFYTRHTRSGFVLDHSPHTPPAT